MKAINYEFNRLKIEKEFSWLMTIALVIAGFPLFKKAIVSILVKLYEILMGYPIA